MPALLLASASPRRATLLSAAGVDHTVTPVDVDETRRPGEPPIPYARRMAETKARSVSARKGAGVILSADTVVWRDPKSAPLVKPRDRDDALRMLLTLLDPDAPHFVSTAYAILDGRHNPPNLHLAHETTRVWMRRAPRPEIDRYLDTDEWKDKAGGYGIQGRAASFVSRIEGSYTNVVGLPVAQVLDRLYEIGALSEDA